MDARARRVGANEVLFREVNDQIEQLNDGFGVPAPMLTIVCECGRGDCVERIAISDASYEVVRREPARFIVLPGHVFPDVEHVVDEGDGYVVIEKYAGGPAEFAAESDRRG